jgi:hypothetical protein
MAQQPPQPGWYPDPAGGWGQRYWDGSAWGPVAPTAPPPAWRRSFGTSPQARAEVARVTLLLFILFPLLCCGSCGVFGLIGAFTHHGTSSSQSTSTTAPAYTLSTPRTYSEEEIESAVLNSCKKSVKKNLKVPDSAKFGDDWKARIVTQQGQPPKVPDYHPENGDKLYSAVGSVNAKNGFGGYTGDQLWACDAVVTNSGNGTLSSNAYLLK